MAERVTVAAREAIIISGQEPLGREGLYSNAFSSDGAGQPSPHHC